ncbi:MFS transporter [Marinomonas flavescens]|uniref:MFS transporter n=1 Tax=Marinomonas flavescens TaxID=2529379 RepID=UPI001056A74E|nr:MFS transporter [Marinomonas flavescens]
MIKRLAQHKYVPAPSHEWLMLATIFLLMLVNFLNVGMIAFAASPLMGELGVSPQEYSLSTAAYAAVAVVTISKQRWLVERMGWRNYIHSSLLIFFIGCFICYLSRNFSQFLIGHVVMGFGGAAFMAGARILITLLPVGPIRFKGIKTYAYGLTISISLAPFLAAQLFINASWNDIFIILMIFCVLVAITAAFCLPGIPSKDEIRSQSHPYVLMALATGSFLTLYALRSGTYDFYSNSILISVILLLGLTSFYYFLRSMVKNHHKTPLLSIKQIFGSKRYRTGILVFFTCYLIMGSNSYFLPQILQKGLGFGWGTIGNWYALGLTSMILGLWIHMKIFPKRPDGKKFFMLGFFCIGLYGFLMSRLSPSTDMQTYILPAIIVYGFFSVFLQGTAAAKSFSELEHDDTAFSHAQQFKNMVSQIAQSMGIALSSIALQWRTTVHYNELNTHITNSNPIYQKALAQVATQYAQHVSSVSANKMALGWIQGLVKQQSILLAGIDYFTLLFFVGIIGFVVMFIQKRLN